MFSVYFDVFPAFHMNGLVVGRLWDKSSCLHFVLQVRFKDKRWGRFSRILSQHEAKSLMAPRQSFEVSKFMLYDLCIDTESPDNNYL